MAKKYSKERGRKGGLLGGLKEETLNGILAVVFFVCAIFFGLSALGKAGVVGKYTYNGLEVLLGIGYFLLPVVLIALGIALLLSIKKNLVLTQSIATAVLFFSALGIIELTFPTHGGILGKGVSFLLVKLFESTISYIILVAVSLISILVVFDTTLQIRLIALLWNKFFGKKEDAPLSTKESVIHMPTIEPAESEAQKTLDKKDAKESRAHPAGKEEDFGLRPLTSRIGTPYTPPPLSLLEIDRGKPGVGDIKANSVIIQRTLMNFGIHVEMDEISVGPSITRYALKPAEGVKLSRIVALQNDLSLALAAHPLRIEAPIPGKSLVGIEMPNSTKTTVGLGTLLSAEEYKSSDKSLLIGLGKVIAGTSRFANLAKMPHLLIAGATGSGKSVTIHAIITSLLYRNSPEQLKFMMIDPKRVELTLYNKIPHLLTPVITDPKKAILALKWAAKEMDRRYDVLESQSVRDIDSYHKNVLEPALKKIREKGVKNDDEKTPETMPYVVVIIDELADIMQTYPRELEAAIVRLAQMSRAVGIHLILSTQRPSVNVITGLIKANVPARIALQVSSQIDSRTILDTGGAEKLLGAGDMLYLSGEMSQPQRIQSAFISESEVKSVVKYLTDQFKDEIPEEIDLNTKGGGRNAIFESGIGEDAEDDDDDELYEEAREIVIQAGKASTSFLQRKLRVGYARAARLIDMLEERGVVSPGSGAKPRDVIGVGPRDETLIEESIPEERV